MKHRFSYLFLILAAVVILTGCAIQSPEQILDPPGFLYGLFHGFIIFFSFIISLFTDYEIYAFPNNGG